MNKADVEFTVGLDTSPAERKLQNLSDKIKKYRTRLFQYL